MWRLSARVRRGWALLLRSSAQPVPAWLRWSAGAVFALSVSGLVADAEAIPVIGWMDVYRLEDFETVSDAGLFFSQLRTGVSPFLAALEIAAHLVLGSTALIDVYLYRASLVLAFAVPFLAFAATRLEFACSLAIGFVFLWSTLIVTQPNPQLYDVLLPLFLLLFALCLRGARLRSARGRSALGCAALAGFFLSMAELSRPIVLVVLPFFFIVAYQFLRGAPKRCLAAFLLPIVLLSGGWHLKLLLLQDGQVIWSNHGGFNLHMAWRAEVDDWPDFVGKRLWRMDRADDGAFLGTGRARDWGLNSQRHAEKSRALTAAVMRYVLREPIDSSLFVARRVSVLLKPKTSLHARYPGDAILDVYRPLVRVTSGWLLLNAILLGALLLRDRSLRRLGTVEATTIGAACFLILLLSIGDAGEEARFVIAVLPLLAVLPRVFRFELAETRLGVTLRPRWRGVP